LEVFAVSQRPQVSQRTANRKWPSNSARQI
jgi:hypothetical protein